MKTKILNSLPAALALGVLAFGMISAPAQDSSASTTVVPAAVAPAPPLAYGVPQILKMAQANVANDTIIAYIKNSGTSYGLNADQIIYLKQQGLSDGIITAMLNQPKAGVVMPAPATPAPEPAAASAVATVPTPTPAPTVTYVQSAPPSIYYYPQPYYYPYYSSYAVYPAVSLSFGWGGGWGGYAHGGYYGGWHGGWHGGGYGGWHGGGWHH